MYEETLKRKPLRGFGTFLSIIILVFAILALMLLVGWLQILWGGGYLQYILLAVVLLVLLFLLLRQITRYVYVIAENTVWIYREIGQKRKILFEIPLRNIEQFGKMEEISLHGKKRRMLLFDYVEKDVFFIAASGVVVVLDPTESFMDKLKEVYEKTHC